MHTDSPPPTASGNSHHERHLSIADSVVSDTADDIRERFRLSVRAAPPPSASSSAFLRHAPGRRDSIFSANTQWTADESFLESSRMISDFPRPPAMIPGSGGRFAPPALPSSSGHAIAPSAWTREPHPASRYVEPSPSLSQYTGSLYTHTESDHPLQPPNPPHLHRPNTAPSTLTVKTDTARYLDPNSNAPIEIVSGPSPTSASPTGTTRFPSPSLLPPLPRSPSSRGSTQSSQYLVPTPSPTERVPGFPVAPPSPATAAYLRSPVMPPSSHTSHEGLLDPGFIRTLMSGIEAGSDGLDLALNSDEIGRVLEETGGGGSGESPGPFGDRYAVEEAYYQEQDDEPQSTTPATSPAGSQGTWFRRAPPAASLPSSPRSSFSFSVRSGVERGGWKDDDAPAVPPIPALYRQAHTNPSTSTGSPPAPVTPSSQTTSFVTTTANGTLRPDWTARRKSIGKETIASGSGISTLTAGAASSGGQSHLSGITEHASTSGEEEAVIHHAALVRTASAASMRPAVYTSTPTSPQGQAQYAGDKRWSAVLGAGHARTTSADLLDRAVRNRRSVQQLQFLSVTHPDTRRSLAVSDVREDDEGGEEDLVYVRREDVVRRGGEGGSARLSPGFVGAGRESSYVVNGRESAYLGSGRESTYTGAGRESAYTGAGRESTYTGAGRDSAYLDGGRDSLYPSSARDSGYPGAWAEPPSPNEMSPSLGSPHHTASSPMMRGTSTMPATPGHGTPSGGALSPLSPYFPGNHDPTGKKAKRVSATSFVSSVFSKFSGHASAGHQSTGTRPTFAFTWRGEEAPPLPTPSPHVARMWEAYNRDRGLDVPGPSSMAHSSNNGSAAGESSVLRREGTMELPALAQRAEKLNEMLELGRLPYRSKSSLPSPRVVDVPVGVDHEGNDAYSTTGGFTAEKPPRARSIRSVFTSISDRSRRFVGVGGAGTSLRSSLVDIPGQQNMRFNKLPEEHRQRELKVQWSEGTGVKPARPARRIMSKRKMWAILGVLIFAIVAIIAISVGLSQVLGRRKPDAGGYTCKAVNQTGRLCDLDSTCVCTSTLAGQCNPLANSVASLIDPVNRFFNPSPAFTRASVALSLWELQGSPLQGANCANQADLIDVGPSLRSVDQGTLAGNRTEFARSALLWTLVMSMDINGTARMQDFIQGLDFSLLDGPNAKSVSGEFMFGAAGYQVDFGGLTVSQPAVSWVGAGKPSEAQVGLVSGELKAALDRVYTFAAASSAQRATALKRYWTNVLQFPAAQLDTFRSIAKASPILLPFDATSSTIRPLFNNANQSFPPPAACYPNLSADELKAINTMETRAFGLKDVTSAPSALDSSCFPSRPVYGVLDMARLRTPFASGNKPTQAVQLASVANSRVSVHLGRALAGEPSASGSSANVTGTDDTRTFGTLDNMDHVLLSYLQAFPSIQAAGSLVEYVLGASDARAPPPSNTSTLFNLTSSLETMPVLEVALFGTVGPDDLGAAVADFANSNGELFFGSSDADAFRAWAVQRAGSVVWADGATASQVVREATRDETFELVWKGASGLLLNAQTTGTKTSRRDVEQVVRTFEKIGYMGS
ncbi:hypothetical protein FRC12_024356 [Ceratobasidium sp. 428]|nr:hypothetical protein FRC12_024356 [Ceratobasidium sp. 428]